jgi:hypothetical protein
MRRSIPLLVALVSLAGCATPPPSPEHLARRITVLPVNNRTGDPLEVAGSGLLDHTVLHQEIVTVSEVLEAEASLLLQKKGFEVGAPLDAQKALKGRVPTDPTSAADLAAQAGLGPLCLYLEIRRWEPEGRFHVKYVIVGLVASLVDTTTRQVLWQFERRPGPVVTPGEILLEAAYGTAAHKVVAEILAPLHPEPIPSR